MGGEFVELSILYIFIDHNKYYGVLKFSIKRDFHNLIINNDVYQINTSDKNSIDIFKNNLLSDPNNPNLLNIIPTKFLFNIKYNYIDSENFLEYIESLPAIVNKQENYKIDFNERLSCIINQSQLKRIYNFFNSFVKNFALLDSVFKIYLNLIKVKEPEIEKPKEEEIEKPIVDLPPKQEIIIKDESILSTIIDDYCLNNILRTYVIQHLFSHLRFINIDISSDKKTITIENLFKNSYISDYNYILSVLKTILTSDLESIITFNQKKILDQIKNIVDKGEDLVDNKLILSVLFFIFYIYQYRYIALKYPDYDFDNYFKIETQQVGINYFVKNIYRNEEFQVVVNELDLNLLEKKEEEKILDEVSQKYKHLIPISQKDFLDLAIKEYQKIKSENKEDDFYISLSSKLINIDDLITNNSLISKILSNDNLINTSSYQRIDSNLAPIYTNKIITKTYYYFKQYVENPLIINNIINTAINIDKIPKSVINLFDYFKRNIHKLFSNKEDTNTLSYYKILKQNIPASDNHVHNTFLYLIYHLIIPYYYDVYKKNIFHDCFLLF